MLSARRVATLLALLGLGAIGWLALAGASLAQVESSGQSDAATIEAYATQCAPCHGVRGEGGVGPALMSSSLTVEAREELIADGRGAMPSFSTVLSSDEIRSIALLMDSFATAEVYATQCAPCHGAAGEGGIGPSLLTAQRSDEGQLAIIRDGLGGMPAFGPTLDAEQLQAVVDFVAEFAASDAVTAEIFAAQCAPCHGAAGEGGLGSSLQSSTLTIEEVLAVISHGAGTMPTFGGTLTPEEIESVAQHSLALRTPSTDTEEHNDHDHEAERGAEVYAEHCSLCHGGDASGGSAPGLVGTLSTTEEMIAIISDGRGSMPGFGGTLAGSDVAAVAAWLAGLESASDVDRMALLPVGAEIYTANCSECHGVDASGGTGPALNATTLTVDEVTLVIRSGGQLMPGFEESLSAEAIDALTVYIETAVTATDLRRSSIASGPKTGQAVYIANCATCHGADAAGGLAPSLTQGRLTGNEIVSQVYGGHSAGMPAFEGVLEAKQIQAAAGYVLSLPTTGSSRLSLETFALLLGLGAAIIVVGLWATGRIGIPPVGGEPTDPRGGSWEAPLEP
ncbi:MAG: c-type cytochrome [Acidimicrobiia bacterium]|nr:c-type cytochrome [Acidimicrobiia bacterium]